MNPATKIRTVAALAAFAVLAAPRATAPAFHVPVSSDVQNARFEDRAAATRVAAVTGSPLPALDESASFRSSTMAVQHTINLHNGQTISMKGILDKQAVMTEGDFLSLQRGSHHRPRSAILGS
jgi:hypothetical protein